MLEAIKTLSEQTYDICVADGACTIEQISNLVIALTEIDEVYFTKFEVPRRNPIWGQFRKWKWQAGYGRLKTKVEVRYASHLAENERKFVVSKELCHALEVNDGAHTASDQAITELINELAIVSATPSPSVPMIAEKLAEFGAVELICPLRMRRIVVSSGERHSDGIEAVAEKFGLPLDYAAMAFNDEYMDMVSTLLS
jgi:hypothetical protein